MLNVVDCVRLFLLAVYCGYDYSSALNPRILVPLANIEIHGRHLIQYLFFVLFLFFNSGLRVVFAFFVFVFALPVV